MMPNGLTETYNFPTTFSFLNIDGGQILSTIMQFSFFGVLFLASVSLLISYMHLVWYGGSAIRGFLSLVVYLAVAVPLFLIAFSLMPELALKLHI